MKRTVGAERDGWKSSLWVSTSTSNTTLINTKDKYKKIQVKVQKEIIKKERNETKWNGQLELRARWVEEQPVGLDLCLKHYINTEDKYKQI